MAPITLITGATSGIGRSAAAAIAAAGHEVIVHGRTARRVERARAILHELVPQAVTHGITADLSRRVEVEAMAIALLARHPRLDVVVHNAAVVPLHREVTADGIELQFAVNHLAPMLLTARLLPLLHRSAPARVVVVASQLERSGRLDFDDLQSERSYDAHAAYCRSKLANVLFANELARRLAGTRITANSLHPGIAGTNILNALRGNGPWLAPWTRYRQPRPENAIATLVRVATDPSLAGVTGEYFREEERAEPSAQARDRVLAARLWTASSALLGIDADDAFRVH